MARLGRYVITFRLKGLKSVCFCVDAQSKVQAKAKLANLPDFIDWSKEESAKLVIEVLVRGIAVARAVGRIID